MVGWLVGRSVGWLVGWSVGQLVLTVGVAQRIRAVIRSTKHNRSVYMLGLEMKGAMIRLKRDATILAIHVGWCVLSFLVISYFSW